ncbi:MAG: hypothetical protein MZV70_56565 [Desulfobacterales bacterium]|nr:hypothetical protein [Desulfobacterales bacterium]
MAEGMKSVFPIFELQIDEKKHIEIIDAARSELADLSSELAESGSQSGTVAWTSSGSR